ncbi:hypothetical protein J1605_004508 [Eschrichtius robustus]|uniref:Uncharacterized protein n=1 Tax=Eschrichtius robustus TaxID=9764 RepID=A0AB34HI15_ESCRO|nr:hypothetical protein J1605_004508 [Eschrichtius robustus]
MAKLEVKTVNPDDAASALPGQDRITGGTDTVNEEFRCTALHNEAATLKKKDNVHQGNLEHLFSSENSIGTSLAAQWLRIHLPMQETRVQALVQEDPTCRRATNPMRHNY